MNSDRLTVVARLYREPGRRLCSEVHVVNLILAVGIAVHEVLELP